MFAKLLKHEWKATAGTLGILSAAAAGAGILGAVIIRVLFTLPENHSDLLYIALSSFLSFIMLGLAGYGFAVWVILLNRYYKNKFTDEGYLTFTLPVNTHCIFLSSLVNMLIWTALSALLLAAVVSLMGFVAYTASHIADSFWFEMLDFSSLAEELYPDGTWVSMLLKMVSGWLYTCVIALTCLTLGSTFAKKHKIMMSFGVFYGISLIMGFINSILTVIIDVANDPFDSITSSSEEYAAMLWQSAGLSIAGQVVMMIAAYLICQHIMKRELNLN